MADTNGLGVVVSRNPRGMLEAFEVELLEKGSVRRALIPAGRVLRAWNSALADKTAVDRALTALGPEVAEDLAAALTVAEGMLADIPRDARRGGTPWHAADSRDDLESLSVALARIYIGAMQRQDLSWAEEARWCHGTLSDWLIDADAFAAQANLAVTGLEEEPPGLLKDRFAAVHGHGAEGWYVWRALA